MVSELIDSGHPPFKHAPSPIVLGVRRCIGKNPSPTLDR